MAGTSLKGASASAGTGIGEIYAYQQDTLNIRKGEIREEQVCEEVEKLESAVSKALLEVQDLRNDVRGKLDEKEDSIFQAYSAILEDRYFINEVRELIASEHLYAENALTKCMQGYMQGLEESGDEYASQRLSDLIDIRTRLIKNITGGNKWGLGRINRNHIVAVEELTPSLAAILGKKGVAGIAASRGAGYLSHAAIILRSMGIPCVHNIDYKKLSGFHKCPAIIDGSEGLVMIEPSRRELEKYTVRAEQSPNGRGGDGEIGPVITKDGHRIGLYANIGNIDEYYLAIKKNVDGIGLVRTEMLYINSKKIPGEMEQFYIYSRIAKSMAQKPVIIRTADIGDDKVTEYAGGEEISGPRGLYGTPERRAQMEIQMRAILRASMYGNVSISFPMVESAEQVKEVRTLLESMRQELSCQIGQDIKPVKAGVVIETKSALENLDSVLNEVDFISIGTNDLLQHVMDLDRENSTLENSEYLDPVFLRTIKLCVDKMKGLNKFVSICGEMAADPAAAVIILGLGVNYLSMRPSTTSRITGVLRKVSLKGARELAAKALEADSAEEVRALCRRCLPKGFNG